MIRFSITRGEARSLWLSLLPHAGKFSEDTPDLGRVRHYITPGTLVAGTTDRTTAAIAVVDLTDQGDELEDFDLDVDSIKSALAVFSPPSNAAARAAWLDGDLELVIDAATVTFREVGDLVEGQALTVPRPERFGTDTYPDVPRVVLGALERARAGDPDALLTPPALARFIPSAKAWGTGLTVRLLELGLALVTAGPDACFAGVLSVQYPGEQDRQSIAKHHEQLHALLGPLSRKEANDG